MDNRVYNFSAGPATLPLPVLEQLRDELVSYPGAGMSVMEMSHRSKPYEALHNEACDNIRTLLQLPKTYRVLFMQGGATMQFALVPMAFAPRGNGAYIVTGSWGKKAIKEAQKYSKPTTAWTGADDKFRTTPAQGAYTVPEGAGFVHFTSNETIEGVEFFDEPDAAGKPLICDASSDFLSRPLPIEQYGLMYAGAQKNLGPAGVSIVIVHEALLEDLPPSLPMVLDYKAVAEANSLLNTPPCFPIYVVALVTRWLLTTMGGLGAIEKQNRAKAQLIYDVIDGSGGYYTGHAETDSRSLMNATFRLGSEELEAAFVKQATAEGLDGLKGHRSVGGCRASIYNAMPVEGCEALAAFMRTFQEKNG